jgi:hypothetical protein
MKGWFDIALGRCENRVGVHFRLTMSTFLIRMDILTVLSPDCRNPSVISSRARQAPQGRPERSTSMSGQSQTHSSGHCVRATSRHTPQLLAQELSIRGPRLADDL